MVVSPPTPSSVTQESPGGDANDPEAAALDRLVNEPTLNRRDQWKTLAIPLADGKLWRRVAVSGYPTRATFRYGDDGHAWLGVYYTAAPEGMTPAACLSEFLGETEALGDDYGVSLKIDADVVVTGKLGEITMRAASAEVSSLFLSDSFVGAAAAYPSFPRTCLVQAIAIRASEHPARATRARDRWMAEDAAKLSWSKRVKEAPRVESR
jgi:hypothetical protein